MSLLGLFACTSILHTTLGADYVTTVLTLNRYATVVQPLNNRLCMHVQSSGAAVLHIWLLSSPLR
jgi:hypothetical protein